MVWKVQRPVAESVSKEEVSSAGGKHLTSMKRWKTS
jgi:hypothetical protein